MFVNIEIQIVTEEMLEFVKRFGKKVIESDKDAVLTAYTYQGNIYITDFKLKEAQCTTINKN